MNQKFKIFKFLFWTVLLGTGFLAGMSWKNTEDSTQLSPINENTTNTNSLPTLPDGLTPSELSTIKLFEAACPSVCFITTSNVRRDYWTMNVTEVPRGTGSAFIWDKEGHIITNYHVIKGADKATVTLNDRSTWEASLIGAAPEKDLAVLKIDAPLDILIPIKKGYSGNLLVGQSVYAIGNPFGLDQTLTTGIISALGREISSASGVPIKDVIQTDAAINPGNSGGPLLNSSGALIAVNTAIYSPSGAYAGIGFSIPADVVNWVVPDLIKYGKINRPTLGLELASERIMRQLDVEGVLVLHVAQGGVAEKAGVRPTYRNRQGRIELGDILVSIDDFPIRNKNDLLLTLEKYKPDNTVTLTLIRNEKNITLDVQLGRMGVND